jgi:hypothetical protein
VTEDREPPKRTAMQVALNAERAAAELREELDNIAALAQAAAESGGSAPVGGVLAELAKDVRALFSRIGEMEDWRAGFLGADGPKGISKVAEDIANVRGAVQKIVDVMPGNLMAGKGGALATQEQVAEVRDNLANFYDSVLAVDRRLREVEEWRTAELDPDNLGAVEGLGEAIRELRADMEALRTWSATVSPRGVATGHAPAAPHVLGLIVELKKQVGAIGKDRQANHQGGRYDFRGVDDAMNAVGNACNIVGIVPPRATVLNVETVRTPAGDRVWTSTTCTMRYTFQSPVDGSEWSTEGIGEGRDLADKSVTKAQAAALKYALFHGLAIPIAGMNVDAETEHPVIDSRDAGRTYGNGQPPAQQVAAQQLDDYATRLGAEPPQDVQSPARAVQQPTRQPDPRTPEELTRDALAAVRRAGRVADAVPAWNWAHQAGYLSFQVEGAQLGQHMLAAIRLLPGGSAVQLPGAEHFQ